MTDLVLVHGFPLDARMWAPLAAHLRPAVRVHALDLPGYGTSAEPPALSIDAMADAVRAFVDDRRLARFALGGLSMGGYVALAYWRRQARVRKPSALVLFDTRAEADGPEAREAREVTARTVREEGSLRPYTERMLPRLLSPDADPSVREALRDMLVSQRIESVVAGSLALRDRADATGLLAGIDVPTLVACGADDALTPPDGMRRLADAIPGASFALVGGAGHLAPMERPAPVADALRAFLGA